MGRETTPCLEVMMLKREMMSLISVRWYTSAMPCQEKIWEKVTRSLFSKTELRHHAENCGDVDVQNPEDVVPEKKILKKNNSSMRRLMILNLPKILKRIKMSLLKLLMILMRIKMRLLN